MTPNPGAVAHRLAFIVEEMASTCEIIVQDTDDFVILQRNHNCPIRCRAYGIYSRKQINSPKYSG